MINICCYIARWWTCTALARQQARQTPRTWRAIKPAQRRLTSRELAASQEENITAHPALLSASVGQELGIAWSMSALGLVKSDTAVRSLELYQSSGERVPQQSRLACRVSQPALIMLWYRPSLWKV